MQHKTQHRVFSIAALIIVFALLLPASLAFVHSTQNHDHVDRCELASDTHMHEKKLDCDLDDIVLHKVVVYAFAKAQLTPPPTYPKLVYTYNPWIGREITSTVTTRGPPVC